MSYAQQIWKFSVLVAVEKQTADYYQKTYSKSIDIIVREQIATVNANFNSSGKFKGIFDFRADSVYVFSGAVETESSKPHPKQDYKIVVNGFSDNSSGGGWYGLNSNTIYHNWKWDNSKGPFDKYATDGLTHEFGHARGEIDIYALKVDAQKNSVNNTGFEPVNSIMNYPYDNITWDEHSVNIINSTSSFVIKNEKYITTSFPNTLGVKAVDNQGVLLKNVALEVYPVDWYSYEVKPTPLIKTSTNDKGLYQFLSNPFQPDVSGYPWNIKYCNFLIKATYNSTIVYKWMPLYEVQNAYFKSGANSIYNAEILFPASTSITLGSVSSTSTCPGFTINGPVTSSGSFVQDNRFTLQLSDASGSFTNPVTVGELAGDKIATINGLIPYGTSAGSNYKIRVVSSKPFAQSNEQPINVQASSIAPTVSSVDFCQGTAATQLSVIAASGGSLLWYISASGGTGLQTAPTPPTNMVGVQTYYVAQTIGNNCQSQRVPLIVTVNKAPAAPTLPKPTYTFCQYAQGETLTATGQSLNWYRESSGGLSLGSKPLPETKDSGVFTYYVSQTISGCEGPRSNLTVKVNEAPLSPSVLNNPNSLCRFDNAPTITILSRSGYTLLTRYVFSVAGGIIKDTLGQQTVTKDTLSITSGLIPTNETGNLIYYVQNRDGNGCFSKAASFSLTIKSIPSAPLTSALSVCQNEPKRTLSASGQNLLWYTTEKGSTGSSSAPTPSTEQPGQTTYYLSQTVEGCESPRASLSVTVKPLPAAPAVASKNICQFTKSEPVSVTGEGLSWYNTDGSKFPSTPLINTEEGKTLTYQVTQTIYGCEGPKATLIVNVLATPEPVVARSIVELCQNASSQPLEATGTNLKWTDPNGVVSTSAPSPPTLNATQKADGDIYYVTQTGANGCESPRVAVKVFVQTVPTMSILGTTTTNLGLEVPLKLTFTGAGPYRFKLSNGLTGTALKDTTVMVLPDRTTTYQVVEVANKCGTGLPGNGATATVTVRVPTIRTLILPTATVCAGTSFTTSFVTSGDFNPGSVFKLQVAKVETDSTKVDFVDVPGSQLNNGQFVGAFPSNTPSGSYWVRVVATNPKIPINGTISSTVLTVRSLATATLTGNQSISEGQLAKLSVAFSGDGPWSFSYRDSSATGLGTVQVVQTGTNPYLWEVRPTKTTSYYLTNVSNTCGNGLRSGSPVNITVSPLLSVDDQSLAVAVEVYPVPTSTVLTVRIHDLSTTQPALLELVDLSGKIILQHETRRELTELKLEQKPAGVYVLRIRIGDRKASRRIVKL